MIGRRITEPIQALVVPAVAIGRGETAAIAPSKLREATDLGDALLHAQELLRQREQAREQAEASLRESQSRLQMALDVSQVGDWDLDLKTGVMRHSLRHNQCFGYNEALIGSGAEDFRKCVHPEDLERVRTHVQEAIRNGSTWKLDCRVVWPDGSVHWIASQGASQSENGVPRFIVGLVTDITDRKQNEELRLHGVRLEASLPAASAMTRSRSTCCCPIAAGSTCWPPCARGGRNSDVPVVVVTMVTETSALAGFQISDVLSKPIRADEIVAAFRRAGLHATAVPRVLVVDDDPAALELMAAKLQAIGMTALCVLDGCGSARQPR